MLPISPKNAMIAEDEEYMILGRMPEGFNPREPETVKTFSVRLKKLRKDRAKHEKEAGREFYENSTSQKKVKPKGYWTQERLANEIGVTPMMVSKYENGRMASIPMERLRRICYFYDVTPHYILGFVDEEHSTLDLDKNGVVKINEDGTPSALTTPMAFAPANFQAAVNEYAESAVTDAEAFWLINKLVLAQGDTKTKCIKILRILLGDSSF